ncbi:MAG: hypothetical protein HPY76_04035 [Anaerolineae bacterium]|nr:hypothetical protein [Anaerolineae bacterium]
MARMIPAAERVKRARKFVQQAREYPKSADPGYAFFSYVAEVKDLLRQARDLIKFIPNTPSASEELKAEVSALQQEIDQTEKDLLRTI